MTSADPQGGQGAPGLPPACTDCGARRHRLYTAHRYVTDTMPGQAPRTSMESATGCRECGHRGPWRLAIAEVLVVRPESPPPPPPVEYWPAHVSKAAIRALLIRED